LPSTAEAIAAGGSNEGHLPSQRPVPHHPSEVEEPAATEAGRSIVHVTWSLSSYTDRLAEHVTVLFNNTRSCRSPIANGGAAVSTRRKLHCSTDDCPTVAGRNICSSLLL